MRLQHVGQAANIHAIDTFSVQPFKQVTTQCFLGVVAATGSLAVQSPNTLATVPAFFEF